MQKNSKLLLEYAFYFPDMNYYCWRLHVKPSKKHMSKQGLCLLWMLYKVYIYFLNSKILFKNPSLPSVHNFIHSAKYFGHLLYTTQSLMYQKDNRKEIKVIFSSHNLL